MKSFEPHGWKEVVWLLCSAVLFFGFVIAPFMGWAYGYTVLTLTGIVHMVLSFDHSIFTKLSAWERVEQWVSVYMPGFLVHAGLLLWILFH